MTQLLQNAAYGAALILTVAVLRLVLRDRLLPGARLALWAVCLFRLLTPAAPESVLSLWGLPRLFAPKEPAPLPVPVTGYVLAGDMPAPAPQPGPGLSWETALLALWLAVGAALAVRHALSWRRTRRAVACAIPLDRDDARYGVLPKCARLREGPMEGAPLTFGVVRPTVVLFPGLDGGALDCVLVHEGVHARRRDNLWHYVGALALAVHWWNPAVWLMVRLLRQDIELSCDRAALNRLGPDRRAEYARTLVSLATQTEGPAFCQTFGRKATEERIFSVMKFKKISLAGAAFSLALVLSLSAAFASEPKTPSNEYGSTTVSSGTRKIWSMSTDADGALRAFSLELDYLEEELARYVANGSMPQEEADRVLSLAREAAQDDGRLNWTFPPDSGLFYHRTGENGGGQPRFDIFYKDPVTGSLFHMDPVNVVSSFVFPAGYVESSYIEEEAEYLPDDTPYLLGEAHIDYDVKLPTFDEDGNPVVTDENGSPLIIGTRFSDDKVEGNSDAVGKIGSRFYSYRVSDGSSDVSGGAVRTSSGTYQLCRDKDCDVSYDHCHINGKAVRAYYQYPGPLCDLPDCSNESPHKHNGVQYAGKAGSFVVLPRNPASSSGGPVFVEQGNPGYVLDLDDAPLETDWSDPSVEPRHMSLKEYGDLLDSLVSQGKMARKEADEFLAYATECLEHFIQAGTVREHFLVMEDSGSFMVM